MLSLLVMTAGTIKLSIHGQHAAKTLIDVQCSGPTARRDKINLHSTNNTLLLQCEQAT